MLKSKGGQRIFKKGKKSLKDHDRYGRPTTATTEENIAYVHRVVRGDRCLTVNEDQYFWHLPWASKVYSAQKNRNFEGFCKMGATAFEAWPKADQADPVTSKPSFFKADQASFHDRFLTQDECWSTIL